MRRIVICNWSGRADPQKMLPYVHQQVIELPQQDLMDEIIRITMYLFNKGINVMLLHREEGALLCVDTAYFGQR